MKINAECPRLYRRRVTYSNKIQSPSGMPPADGGCAKLLLPASQSAHRRKNAEAFLNKDVERKMKKVERIKYKVEKGRKKSKKVERKRVESHKILVKHGLFEVE